VQKEGQQQHSSFEGGNRFSGASHTQSYKKKNPTHSWGTELGTKPLTLAEFKLPTALIFQIVRKKGS